MNRKSTAIIALLLFSLAGFSQQIAASFSADIYPQPFTGNVIAYLSKDNKQPISAAVGFDRSPCFAMYVKDVKPGQVITINDMARSYPTPLTDMERGRYYLQVVWDRNLGGRSIAETAGNLYNPAVQVEITKDLKKTLKVVATSLIAAAPAFAESEFVKEMKVDSKLLGAFHRKAMTIDAAVVLPKEYYKAPTQSFPVLFQVFGYGGDYRNLSGSKKGGMLDSLPVITVYLDGNGSLGHHEYANSENNGPWGDALVTEFIPALEKKYRSIGANMVTGHSSGGWSALWLQTQYPETFIASWASSPDAVDFNNFSGVNLYEDQNIFYDSDSSLRQVATVAGQIPWASMKAVYQAEHVIYRGEQMHSFDAVFSKRAAGGQPERICNEETGVIDKTVFEHWKKYDIAAFIKNNWQRLQPLIDNKVRVSVGKQDNFFLNRAVTLLETQMKGLQSGFQFAYYPGDHFTLATPQYMQDGYRFLKEKYLAWLDAKGK